jgi:hypothetical protein
MNNVSKFKNGTLTKQYIVIITTTLNQNGH